MVIKEIEIALNDAGINVSSEAIRNLLKVRYNFQNPKNQITIFSEEIGREIIQYYKLKLKNKPQ